MLSRCCWWRFDVFHDISQNIIAHQREEVFLKVIVCIGEQLYVELEVSLNQGSPLKLIPVWIFFILKPRSKYCFSVLWWTIYLSLSFTFRWLCLPHLKSPFLKSKWMIVMIARNFSPVNTVKVIGIPPQIRFSIISSLSGSLYNLGSRFFTCNAPSQANPGVEKYQTESSP